MVVLVTSRRHIEQPATAVIDAAAVSQRAADNEPAVPSNAASAAVVNDDNTSQPAVWWCTARSPASEQRPPCSTGDA